MGRQIGDVATYQCNTGFELDGPEIRTCNQLTPGVADWAPGEPLCRRMLNPLGIVHTHLEGVLMNYS